MSDNGLIEIVATEKERLLDWLYQKVHAIKSTKFRFDDDTEIEEIPRTDIHIYRESSLRKIADTLGLNVEHQRFWSRDPDNGTWWERFYFYFEGIEVFTVNHWDIEEKENVGTSVED